MQALKPWWLVSVLVALALIATGCTGAPPPVEPSPERVRVAYSAGGDPIPVVPKRQVVGSQGARIEGAAVVEVPAGAVPDGREVEVGVGDALGAIDGLTQEVFGAPVLVVHDVDLEKPIRVRWNIGNLTEEQRSTILLVRWNDEVGMWQVPGQAASIEGDTLVADLQQFSFWTWVSGGAATVSQVSGEVFGKRTSAPTCSSGSLPGWVRNVVRPDEDQSGMPIRTCVEPDKNDVLTVRVANNRPYTQSLDLVNGDRYAWAWAGEEDFTVAGIIRGYLNRALSDDNSLAMAPAKATAVGLGRPDEMGEVQLTLQADPTMKTVAADILIAVLGSVLDLDNVGGFDSDMVNAFVQTIYDCGGSEVLKSREGVGLDTFGKAFETVKTCGTSTEVHRAIQQVLLQRSDGTREGLGRALGTNRALQSALGKLGIYLKVADFSSYTSELASSSMIGKVQVTVFGTGRPQMLGEWKPDCRNADSDSGVLFKNLALQDVFKDTSKEYWKFSEWEPSAKKAVQPLNACKPDHIEAVAANVEKTWGDKKAAAVVALKIRALAGGGLPSDLDLLNSTLPANVCWTGESGWQHAAPIKLKNGQGAAWVADRSYAEAGIMETKVVGRADVDGDGEQEVVLDLACAGSEPERCCAGRASLMPTIGVFKPGTPLRQVAPSLMGGASEPGGEFGPADRRIDSISLRGKVIVTQETIIYPEGYTAAQVGGDPSAAVTVEYQFKAGKWVASRP